MLIKKVIIIGGGAASFTAALALAKTHQVTIYEKGKTIGRKYLVAGKGGFNLSNHLSYPDLVQKYSPSKFLDDAIAQFTVTHLIDWYSQLGIETFTGTSNRIFPVAGISPADVLRAIKKALHQKGVVIKYQHEFVGFMDERPQIKHQNTVFSPDFDMCIFSLGGASWKVTGSGGEWLPYFQNLGVTTYPFMAANCGVHVNWAPHFIQFHEAKPLKNIAVKLDSEWTKGEALITKYGLEGNAIYPISSAVGKKIHSQKTVIVYLDLKPQITLQEIQNKFGHLPSKSLQKALKLSSTKWALLKSLTSKEQFINTSSLINLLKELPVFVDGLRPINEAISTIGGIDTHQLTPSFQLKSHPQFYCIGEMVNWDAPTGGFLLHGCFAMGYAAALDIQSIK